LFGKVNGLPEELQENLAVIWNEDIENEINFDNRIYESLDKLSILAKEALTEYKLSN
jgi:hypothetical protein